MDEIADQLSVIHSKELFKKGDRVTIYFDHKDGNARLIINATVVTDETVGENLEIQLDWSNIDFSEWLTERSEVKRLKP